MLLILTTPSLARASERQLDPAVSFEDSNLDQCVRSNLQIDSEIITTSDLANLTSLSCPNQNISNLSGIENAVNLDTLNLMNNNISDISNLSQLKNLKHLDLASNNITDIDDLSGLRSLISLKLSDNQISDITIIENLVNLERFEANSNQITDVDSLSTLNNLHYLQLNHNQISNITVISNLTEIRQILVDDNNITSIPSLANLSNLKQLSLSANNISQLTDISNTNINTLIVSDNQLTSIEQLGSSNTLKVLNLSNNNINSLDGLESLSSIEQLNLSYNQIQNIENLSASSNLKNLNLRNNKIDKLNGFDSITSLEELNLSQNQISQTIDISNLENLKTLNLSENRIIDASKLQNLDDVKINLENQIVELEPKVVDVAQSVSYTIRGINNERYPIIFTVNKSGTVRYKKTWNSQRTNNTVYSGTIYQDITYSPKTPIVADSKHSIDEEQYYTDQQLLTLFGVESQLNQQISVDQSKVDYSKPGSYDVIFKDQDLNQITVNLQIVDLKPTIVSAQKNVVIDSNSGVVNYLDLYKPVASEITTGDLNAKITIDDNAVNFDQSGTYRVKFKVIDEEGNSATEIVTLTNRAPSNEVVISTIDPDISVIGNRVQVNKFSRSGESLAGFKYLIYDEDGNIIDVIVTDEDGHAESKDLLPGHYYVEQVGGPEESSTSTINEDNAATLTPAQSTSSEAINSQQIEDQSEVSLEQTLNNNDSSKANKDQPNFGSEVLVSETHNVFEKKDSKGKIIILVLSLLVMIMIIFIIVKVKKNE